MFKFCPCHLLRCISLGKLHYLSESRGVFYLQNGNDNHTHLTRLSWGSDEKMPIKCLAECLAWRKHQKVAVTITSLRFDLSQVPVLICPSQGLTVQGHQRDKAAELGSLELPREFLSWAERGLRPLVFSHLSGFEPLTKPGQTGLPIA